MTMVIYPKNNASIRFFKIPTVVVSGNRICCLYSLPFSAMAKHNCIVKHDRPPLQQHPKILLKNSPLGSQRDSQTKPGADVSASSESTMLHIC